MRVCSTPRCPTLVETGRCGPCSTEYEQRRGTRQARGYGAKHERLRKRWAPKVATGKINCWRCEQRISPLEPWDLGHDDTDRSVWRGPEHVLCNRATSSR